MRCSLMLACRFIVPYKATEAVPLTEDQEIVNKAYSQRRMPA